MSVVKCDMRYLPVRWNCWDESEGEWFRIKETPRFKQGIKYTVLLPSDIKSDNGISPRFFLGAFRYTELNMNDFTFPGFQDKFEECKEQYGANSYAHLTLK